MNLKTLMVAAALAAAGASAVLAQDTPPAGGPGGGPSGGMGGPSPEMRAARQAMIQACSADAKTLCEGKQGHEMMMCMRGNADKVSQPCKDAMAKMPHRGPPPPAPN